MNDVQAFKVGFQMQCAREGLTAEETRERMEKAAVMLKMANPIDWLTKLIGGGGKMAGGVAAPLLSHGLTAALVGPPLAGVAAGYGLSRMNNDVYNKDEARTDEELAELYRAIDELERSQRVQAA